MAATIEKAGLILIIVKKQAYAILQEPYSYRSIRCFVCNYLLLLYYNQHLMEALAEKELVNANVQTIISKKPQIQKFAFLIHFRNDISEDMKLYWKPLKLVPEKFYKKLFYNYSVPSTKWSSIKNSFDNQEFGRNEILPLNPEMFFKMGPKKITERINKVLDKMVDKGCTIAGLGALTSPLTGGGKTLEQRTDIGITNGNAFTAVILNHGVRKLVEINHKLTNEHAIVGASGSVGSCLARLIVKDGNAKNLLLLARKVDRLEKLREELLTINPFVNIRVSADMQDLKSCDMITLLTASADNLMSSDFLKQDVVILDSTQPRNTSPALLIERPDVSIIDGGIAHVPGITLDQGSFGLPKDYYFACFSETALLAIAGHKGHFCLGNPTLEQAEYIEELAQKHAAYGFELSKFISFGKPLVNSIYAC